MATINGTSGNDALSGNGDNDTISGFAGDDTLSGLGGNDSILGNDGNDTLAGNDGDDTLRGGEGIDFLQGGAGDDLLNGENGFDFTDYRNALGAVTVNLSIAGPQNTGEGSDTLVSIEAIYGSAFADTLTGDGNSNQFSGLGGVDTIDGGGGEDWIDYALATLPVSVNLATLEVSGPDGADVLISIEGAFGGLGNDTLIGSDGNNRLRGRAGDDSIDGAGGFDTADYSFGTTFGVTVDLASGSATGGGGNDVLLSMEAVLGSPYGDTLIGDAQANQLTGGAGDDWLVGRAGNDTIDGGTGTDVVHYLYSAFGGGSVPATGVTVNLATGQATDNWGNTDLLSNVEMIYGSAYADRLTGGNPANGSNATDGLEGFRGEGGNDTIDGGTGFDRAYYDSSPVAVGVTLGGTSPGTASDGFGTTDTLINIEEARGSQFNDTLTGSDSGGFESFEGRAGNDTIDGKGGTDRVNYQTSPAGVFVDLAAGTASDGWGGRDTFSGIEQIRGSEFADVLRGDAANNDIEARAGSDLVFGGDDGTDTLRGGAGDDTMDGGDNFRWFELDFAAYNHLGGGVTVNLSTGIANADGTDTLTRIEGVWGSSGNDRLTGAGAYLESFRGEAGNDTIDGGAGYDIADYITAGSAVTLDLSKAQDQATGGGGTDQLISIELIRGSHYDDLLVGNDEENSLRGNRGNDTLRGGGGDDFADYFGANGSVTVDLVDETSSGADGSDQLENIEGIYGSNYDDTLRGDEGDNTIRGAAGNDTIDGRDGRDTASYTLATGGVTVNLATGTSSGADGVDTLIGIEDVLGGLYDDSLIGNDGDNRLSGDDTEFGGAGDDTLYGGLGNDTIEGGGGLDIADYLGAPGAVSASLATGSATGSHGSDELISIEAVAGSAFADTLTGGDGDEGFRGNGGNDTIDGGGGRDWLAYDLAAGSVTVNLGTGAVSGADGVDQIRNVENVLGSEYGDWLLGDDAANILEGIGGNDELDGVAGDDTLIGGGGNDTIDGWNGTDTVVYDDRELAGSGYTVLRAGAVYTVNDLKGSDGTDRLTDVERLQFADYAVNLVVQDKAADTPQADVDRLIELYVAFFNRVPDADGMSYWIDQKNGGQTINQIAESFYNAGVQFSNLTGFSADMTNADFVDVVYRNVLGREDGADEGGMAYWTGELAAGRESRGSLVSTMLDSAHSFKGDPTYGYVADLLDNKIVVSRSFAIDWGLNFNTPEDSILQGIAIADAITPTSIDAAIALIGIEPGQLDLS